VRELEIAVATPDRGIVEVEVGSARPVVDLCLLADMVDPNATVDTQLITLLPGERHTFAVSTDQPDRFDGDAIDHALFSAGVARF
jgi:beta-mannosidase